MESMEARQQLCWSSNSFEAHHAVVVVAIVPCVDGSNSIVISNLIVKRIVHVDVGVVVSALRLIRKSDSARRCRCI